MRRLEAIYSRFFTVIKDEKLKSVWSIHAYRKSQRRIFKVLATPITDVGVQVAIDLKKIRSDISKEAVQAENIELTSANKNCSHEESMTINNGYKPHHMKNTNVAKLTRLMGLERLVEVQVEVLPVNLAALYFVYICLHALNQHRVSQRAPSSSPTTSAK